MQSPPAPIPALRDWMQWCTETAPTTVSDAAREKAGHALQQTVRNLPDDTNWGFLAAQLALAIQVPEALTRQLCNVPKRSLQQPRADGPCPWPPGGT
jgi:hypothetical protein